MDEQESGYSSRTLRDDDPILFAEGMLEAIRTTPHPAWKHLMAEMAEKAQNMRPMEETAIYRYALLLYREYMATKEHDRTPELQAHYDAIIDKLHLDVYDMDGSVQVTFLLTKDMIDG